MAVPPEFIEDLRQRIPLSDVIGKRVKLTRKGRRFTGLCPFHSEKTGPCAKVAGGTPWSTIMLSMSSKIASGAQ